LLVEVQVVDLIDGGGGGAGGYRTTFPSPGCNAGAFPIAATNLSNYSWWWWSAASAPGSNSFNFFNNYISRWWRRSM
jgi:hypothetical protein